MIDYSKLKIMTDKYQAKYAGVNNSGEDYWYVYFNDGEIDPKTKKVIPSKITGDANHVIQRTDELENEHLTINQKRSILSM